MGRQEALKTMVDGYLAGDYERTKVRSIPLPKDVPLGKKAAVLEATTLFVDLRQSSDITNTFRRQTAAKMLKAYFHGAVSLVRAHDGEVRSFNGDGILALFMGDSRADDAVRAAMEMKWFIEEILWDKFDRYFTEDSAKRGAPLKFSVACGIDDGHIYAVKVGMRGTNDVAWVGRSTNTAAKLSNVLNQPATIGITSDAYQLLSDNRKTTSDGRSMWSTDKTREFGGVERKYRTSTFRRPIS